MTRFNISEWGLRHQSLLLYFIIVLMGSGGVAFFDLGQRDLPNFTVKTMIVRTLLPGATAKETDQLVTETIEEKLIETPWLDFVSSFSKPGESAVLVVLKDYIPNPKKIVPDIWYQVRKKVSDIRSELPPETLGPFFNDEFGDVFELVYGFTGKDFSYAEIKDYAESVRNEVLRAELVEKAVLVGAQKEKVFVEIDHHKLASLRIDPFVIINALRSQNMLVSAGAAQTSHFEVPLRVSGPFRTVDDIKNLTITAGGRQFLLGNIAQVGRGYEDPPVYMMRVNGEPAVGLAVSMRDGANVLELAESVQSIVDDIRPALPAGLELHLVADQASVVSHSLDKFLVKFFVAVAIVLLASYVSLGLRTGLVVATTVPLVLGIVFLTMLAAEIDMHRISLGALILSLGLLVDDAIIIVEMIHVKLAQGWDRIKAATFAYTSTSMPMLSGTLVSVAGFLPVYIAHSAAAEMLSSLFLVLAIALITSWVVAVLFTPLITFKLLPSNRHPEKKDVNIDIYTSGFYRRFRRLVRWCVTYRKTVVLLTCALIVLSLYGLGHVSMQFFPLSDRKELLIEMWLPEGSNLQGVKEQVIRIENYIESNDDIVEHVAYLGGDSPRVHLDLYLEQLNSNFARFLVLTRGGEARERALQDLRRLLKEEFPMVRSRVTYMTFGPPVDFPLSYRVIGSDHNKLRNIAGQVTEVIKQHPATFNVHSNWREPITALRAHVDQAKASALGVSAGSLAENINMLINGLPVSQFREENELIDIVVRTNPAARTTVGLIDELNLYLKDGKSIPLAQIAHLEVTGEEGVIWRYNRYPAISVRAEIPQDVLPADVVDDLEPRLDLLRAKLPIGYHIEIAGIVEVSNTVDRSFQKVLPIIAIIILTVLMLQTQSMSMTALVLLTSPLGLIGVVLALLAFDIPFGLVARLGVVALAGIIMRNSIILIDQIKQDLAQGLSKWEAIIESTVRRCRPIVLTALAAILAMIPLTTDPFWGPMAVAFMAGLFVATFLTLFSFPAMYAAWFRVQPPQT
ncbi:MAG: efflux RND transporter permease subunit [Thermodesulfobacteriota bacterium]|nr:efflux RND transporter permease subunit [Thermodesulfobacteriota bacterium]